ADATTSGATYRSPSFFFTRYRRASCCRGGQLRTPLAAILGYAELMQEGFYEAQGPKSIDALNRIRSNGKHLLGLINTLLDIAKIESGQFTLSMADYASRLWKASRADGHIATGSRPTRESHHLYLLLMISSRIH